jgi:membrane fusion protein (multidrug efflux system)
MNINLPLPLHPRLAVVMAAALLAGCGRGPNSGAPAGAPAGAGAMPPTEVGVVSISTQSLPLAAELPGRVNAERMAEVRARATGILLKRLFDEGAEVQADQLLFQIDPAPLQAAYDSAKAALDRAEATLEEAQSKARRNEALLKINGVSRQAYEDAKAAAAQSVADAEAAKAALEMASLNLGYTKVTAPIAGRIGKAMVTEGALVSAAEATKLAVVQQLDPIYVDFTQASAEALRTRRALEAGLKKGAQARVTLLLEDGTAYPHQGRFVFSDISVDETTGSVILRAEFPNPDRLLLPGAFVRGRVEAAVDTEAITVPQRAVSRDPSGQASVLLVNASNQVEPRLIQTDAALGDRWVVRGGLTAGERVIVEGLQKVRPGMTVVPTPFQGPGEAPAAAKN